MSLSVGNARSDLNLAQVVAIAEKYTAPKEQEFLHEGIISRITQIDIFSAFSEVVVRVQRLFSHLEQAHRTHVDGKFISSRSVDVWHRVQEGHSELLTDFSVFSRAFQEGVIVVSPKAKKDLEKEQSAAALTIYLHAFSQESHTLLDQVQARLSSGISILNADHLDNLYSLLKNWQSFLNYCSRRNVESNNQEFIKRFDQVAGAVKLPSGASVADRVYYHVWDQAKKEGMNPEGDNWGKENALGDIPRLQRALELTRRDLFLAKVEHSLQQIKMHAERSSVKSEGNLGDTVNEFLTAWSCYLKNYPSEEDNAEIVSTFKVVASEVKVKGSSVLDRISSLLGSSELFADTNRLQESIAQVKKEVLYFEVEQSLDKIRARVAAGASKFDQEHANDLRGLVTAASELLTRYSSEENRSALEKLFVQAANAITSSGVLMGRIYFYVWDLAVKAGESPIGDSWGEANAFNNLSRLVDAISLVRDEVIGGTSGEGKFPRSSAEVAANRTRITSTGEDPSNQAQVAEV